MKTKLVFILVFFLCSNAPEKDEKIADIINNRQIGWPSSHTEGHQNKDFEIYAIGPTGRDSAHISKETYAMVTYRMKDNELKFNMDFLVGFDEVYEKVSYKWISDTVLLYRMFNLTDTLTQNMSLVFHKNGNISCINERYCHYQSATN